MTKRVLAFLMVMAMVLSMIPAAVMAEGTADPGYSMTIQKAHNQTANQLAVDVYLQANTAEQGDVTGYQFTVSLPEGLSIVNVEDFTENDGIAGAGKTFLYSPTLAGPIAVGTSRKLVATIILTGANLPAQVKDALTLTDVTVSVENGFFSNDEADKTAEGYKGAVAVSAAAYSCTEHTCGHSEGEWTPITAADLGKTLTSGNYYLIEDVSVSTTTLIEKKDQTVNICLNGYTWESSARLFEIGYDEGKKINAENAVVNICDCTATGTGENLKAGKLVLKHYQWGNLRVGAPNSKLTVKNIILEGAAPADKADSLTNSNIGNGATFFSSATSAGSLIYAENLLIKDVDAGRSVVDIRTAGYFKDITFVNCNGGANVDTKAQKYTDDLAIFAINGGPATSGDVSLTIDGCKFIDCDDETLFTNGKTTMAFTLKGDVQADGAFKVNSTCKLNLDLGEKASVVIQTATDRTEETIGENLVVPEGGALPAGTALYKNENMFLGYENGKIIFVGHAHDAHTYDNGTDEGHEVEGMNFKAWSDDDALPTEGKWYLTKDVTINRDRYTIARGKTLNLDLNGHTVTQAKKVAASGTSNTSFYKVEGTLNLFDCCSGYDADGNWIGGKMTGGTGTLGGAIYVERSDAGKTNHGVFNMYGGRLEGNNTKSSGGAVYCTSALAGADATAHKSGGVFNMYGGEIYNNSSTAWGGAVTLNGYNPAATSGSKGLNPELGMSATFNMHGGKIHGNTTVKSTGTNWGDGTIRVEQDAIMNMTGGEICDNRAERGGAFVVTGVSVFNVTGGSIHDNVALESAEKTVTKGADKSSNYAGKGGVLYVTGGKVTIKNIEICDNTATIGGAFYISGSKSFVTIEDCVIDGNTAHDTRTNPHGALKEGTKATYEEGYDQEWGNGGAVYITGNSTTNPTLDLINCQITNNEAKKDKDYNAYHGTGGAIYANYTNNVTVTGCTFTGNVTELESGAAIYVRNGAIVDVQDSVFTENTAGVVAGGIYVINDSELKLTDTLVYGNNTTGDNKNGAGVYICSSASRIVMSGKVVIAENTHKEEHLLTSDLFFQSQSSRTKLAEVDELGAGSHVNLYFDYSKTDSTIISEDKASGYVQLAPEATQSDWECGWITVASGANKTPRTVAYLDLTDDNTDNKTFEFGHYHKDANGDYYELTPWTGTASLPDGLAENGHGYYLTKDVTVSSVGNKTEVKGLTAHHENGLDFELCLNGHSIGASVETYIFTLRSANAWIGDCTASFDENGHLLKGSTISGVRKAENGTVFFLCDDSDIGATMTFYGLEVKDNEMYKTRGGIGTTGYGGGALHVRNKSVSSDKVDVVITGCRFANNVTGADGGAIEGQNGVDFTITDTVFEGNRAGRFGGAISIGYTAKNSAPSISYTPTSRSELTLENCKFINNTVTTNPVSWTDDTETTENETITPVENSALGGAISTVATDLVVNNCYFEGNQAVHAESQTNIDDYANLGMGGAIYVNQKSTLTISGTDFVDNHADYQGGAVYIYGNTSHTDSIMSTSFNGNTAYGYGGAIFQYGSANRTTVGSENEPVSFIGNKAMGYEYQNGTNDDGTPKMEKKWGYGGAWNLNNGQVTVSHVQFYENEARFGGAMQIAGGSGTTQFTASNCYFADNSASLDAGAVMVNGDPVTFTNTEFVGNTAGERSGALHVGPDNSKDDTNTDLLTLTNVKFKYNSATSGGVMGVFGGDRHKVAPTVNITNGEFEGNTAYGYGGIVYTHSGDETMQAQPTITFTNSTITDNHSPDATGGVLYNGTSKQKGANVTFNSCTITDNSAKLVSVAQLYNSNKVTLNDTVVTGNWMTGGYGAVNPNSSASQLHVSGSTVIYDNYRTGSSAADQFNVYMRDYQSAISVYVDDAGLTQSAKIGVTLQGTGTRVKYHITNDNAKPYEANFVADQDTYAITTIDASTRVYITQAGYGDAIYANAQKAIDAINAAVAADPNADKTLKLYANVGANLTSASDLFIDLDGKDIKKLTMAEGTKVTLIDSETNDFTVADGGYGKVTVEGDYALYHEETAASGAKMRYITIAEEDGTVSAHRVYVTINKKLLRTYNNGVGFKALFAGDEIVAEYMGKGVEYGIDLTKSATFEATAEADMTGIAFTAGLVGGAAPNERTAVVTDVLYEGAADNQANAETKIYGRPYMKVNGEKVVIGNGSNTSLIELAKNALGNEGVKDAVETMLNTFGVVIK